MATLAELVVNLTANADKYNSVLHGAAGTATKVGGAIIRAGAVAGAALGGVAIASGKMAVDFQADMATVGTLLGKEGSERVKELGSDVKRLAQETGKPLSDLAGGAFQVVSAFGDSADAAKQLEIAAKAAAAGGANTTDSINLLAAVTKGYGDTSADALKKVADLAFKTNELGQTSFPELAANMGKVVPLAASLGASQEELFGIMASATGVTGNTAEVATQLRGVFQSLMAPTADMSELFKSLGVESGAALIKQEGLQGAMLKIVQAAETSGEPLQKFMGSIEGQTLALAAAGPLQDAMTQKMQAMTTVSGAATAAFEIQQATAAAAFDRIKSVISVASVELGERFLPILATAAEWIGAHMPQIQAALSSAFEVSGQAMAYVADNIIPALVTAFEFIRDEVIPPVVTAFKFVRENFDVIGPAIAAMALMVIVPAFVAWAAAAGTAAIATITALAPVLLPIAAVGLAVAGLTLIWKLWGDDIQRLTREAIDYVSGKWDELKRFTTTAWDGIKKFLVDWWPLLLGALGGPVGLLIGYIYKNWDEVKATTISIWNSLIAGIRNVVGGAWNTISGAFRNLWDSISGWFTGLVSDAVQWGRNMIDGLWQGVQNMAGEFARRIGEWVQTNITGRIKGLLGISSPSTVFAGFGGDLVAGLAQGINDNKGVAVSALTGTVDALTAQGVAFATVGRSLGDDLAAGLTAGVADAAKRIPEQVAGIVKNVGRRAPKPVDLVLPDQARADADRARAAVEAGELDGAAALYADLFGVPIERAREFAEDLAKNLPSFDRGGTVPGAIGQPMLAMVHGGEQILTPAQQRQGGNDTSQPTTLVIPVQFGQQKLADIVVEGLVLASRSGRVRASVVF